MKRILFSAWLTLLLCASLIPSIVLADDDPPPDNWTGWQVRAPASAPAVAYGEAPQQQPAQEAAPLIHALAAPMFQQGQSLPLTLDLGLATTVPAGPNDLIAETARGLDYDWAKCYLFVRNQIRYTPCKGFMRGPERTLLDREGSDGDQAFLLLALLQMSGYTATVRYAAPPDEDGNGGFRIPLSGTDSGYDAAAWVGASATGTVDNVENAVWAAMGQGGQETCFWLYDTPPSIVIEHFWVQMTLSNATYNLDASFKPRRMSLPGALLTDMGYNRTNFLALAGGTTNDYSVQGLNTPNLTTELARLSTNLVAKWQAAGTNAAASAFIGGDSIIPQDLATDANTFHGIMNGADIGFLDQNDAYKNSFRAQLIVRHRGFTNSMWMDEIAARHLWLAYTNATEAFPKAQLRLDDSIILATEPSGSSTWTNQPQIYTYHPAAGASMTATYTLSRALTNVYAIPIGFGGDHRGGMRDRVENDLGRVRASGLAETNILLRSRVLQLVGQQWLAQCALINEVDSRIKGTHQHFYYDLGIAAQESAPYVDLRNAFSYSSADPTKFDGFMLFSSALEHGVLDQVNGTNRPAVSTIRVMDLANTSNSPIYLATPANWNSKVKPALTNYDSGPLGQIDNAINVNGDWVLLPKNGKVVLHHWNGCGYIDKGPYTTAMMIGGYLSGGFTGDYGPTSSGDAQTRNQESSQQDASVPAHYSVDPIDMQAGASLVARSDLVMSGPTPLAWARAYDSRMRWVDGPLGRGWTHTYDTKAIVHADPDAFFGRSSPAACVPSAVASAVVADLLATGENAKDMATACLVVKWWTDQLVDGAVTVNTDNQALSFARSPDGSYTPSPGVTASFAKSANGQFTLQERLGRTWTFATNGVLSSIVDPSGNATALYYSNATVLVAVSNSFGGKLTINWNGNHVSSVSDSANRTVGYQYSSPAGCLTGVTDAANYRWGLAYDASNAFLSETDPSGVLTVGNAYNALCQVTNQLSANGFRWNFGFAAGTRGWDCDPFTNRIVYIYNDDGRIAQQVNRDNTTNSFFYDGQGQMISNLDAIGRATISQYDANNQLVSLTEAANTANARSTVFSYDGQHQLTAVSNALGRVTHLGYDSCHRLVMRLTPDGTTVTNVYGSYGLLSSTTVKDASGRTLTSTTFGYDGRGFATSAAPTDGGTVHFGYDNAGNVTNVIDAMGHPTSIAYDPRGMVSNTVDALNGRTVRTYTSAGRLATVADVLLHTNTFFWTAAGHPAGVRLPNGGVATNTYDAANRLVTVQDPRGNRVSLDLDVLGRVTRSDTANWQQQAWYSAAGCITTKLDAVNGRTDIGYDFLNRPGIVIDPMDQTWTNIFDTLGGLSSVIDPKHRTTSYGLDAMERRTSIAYPSTRTEGFGLDALGRLTAFTNSEGHVYRLAYDGQSRVIAATNGANEQVFRNFFDPCGNLTNRLDGAGRNTRRQFDVLNRCTNTIYSDGSSETFTFDAAGNLLTARNAATTNAFGYDSMNRLAVSTSRVAGVAFATAYQRDMGGNTTNLTYPGGNAVRNLYDSDGRVTNVTDWLGHTWGMTRDAAGRITGMTYPGRTTGSFSYEASHAVKAWSYAGSNGLPGRTITRDAMGLKTREDLAPGSTLPQPTANRRAVNTFNYADRLTGAVVTLGTNTFNETYGYDGCGALTNLVRGTGTNDVFSYDLAGRLVCDMTTNSLQSTTGSLFSCAYDALGNRVRTSVNGTNRLWVVDHSDPLKRPLMETTTNGVLVRYYIWGAGRLLGIIESNNVLRCALADDSGSVVALTDAGGNVTDTFSYGPYGENWGRTGTNSIPFGWLGGHGVFHVDGGSLYLTRYRAYDTTLKRFLSQDLIGLGGGANLYMYALGNPLAFTDPFGLGAESLTAYPWYERATDRAAEIGANLVSAAFSPITTTYDASTAFWVDDPSVANGINYGLTTALSLASILAPEAGPEARALSLEAKGIANEVPSTLARVVPGSITPVNLGRTGAADVYVTAADDIAGMNAAQIQQRLTIKPSSSYTVIEFPTPDTGLASPINRLDPGFVGGGQTAGGAREFVLPNGPLPPGTTIRSVP